jgi:XTP/dITP diphosphohydrolase
VSRRAALLTRNAGKAAEYARLLPGLAVEPLWEEVVEDADTFAGNALRKARAAHRLRPDAIALGDDSGLEVDALGGAPGVRSARLAPGDDAARVARLLELLEGEEDRRAAFVCVLAAVLPDGAELVAEGRLAGEIARRPAGEAGFGYDPVFVPEGETSTLGVLGAAVKDRLSHRARAAARLLAALPPPGAGGGA